MFSLLLLVVVTIHKDLKPLCCDLRPSLLPRRNTPKCSNRKHFHELRLIDARGAATPSDMFDVCLELLETASMSCATTANIAVFKPQTPGSNDGPRVWNNQLIRWAQWA